MIKTLAFVFGVVFVIVGVLGFFPAFTPGGLLLGYFHVNLLHNVVHLASGVVALACGFSGYAASKIYFQVFGVVYGIVAVLGFVYGNSDILGILANNVADTWLHVVIAAISLYLGFVHKG